MKTLVAVSACLATLALTGCAGHSHSLIPEDSDPGLTVGMFRHLGPEGTAMVLEFGGKRFEASGFAIHRNHNLAELRRRYGSGRHYDRIFSGTDTDHFVYSAQPELRSGDGAAMRCSVAWRANGSPAGNCVPPEGKRIDVRFE